jgi:hypothetical protein
VCLHKKALDKLLQRARDYAASKPGHHPAHDRSWSGMICVVALRLDRRDVALGGHDRDRLDLLECQPHIAVVESIRGVVHSAVCVYKKRGLCICLVLFVL